MKKIRFNVTVLMSTYNGEKFLCEQLDSILNQTNVNVHLVIRDDCSSDRTLELLHQYEEEHSNITIIEGHKNLNACKSFFSLICDGLDDDYYALADQDDIWDKDKLYIAITKIQQQEDASKPILYYSNLRIVDEKGIFCRISHSKPHITESKYTSLYENLATGCTIVYNRKLAQMAQEKKPKSFSIHDAWLFMVCEFFGVVIYDFDPHISYRQHENNEIGTYKKNVNIKKIINEIKIMFMNHSMPWLNNALEFKKEFSNELSDVDMEKVKEFVNYKNNIKSRIKLLTDKSFDSKSCYRRIRFKIQVLMGTI